MCECEDERGRAPTGLSISLSFKKNVWHTKRAILGYVYVQNIVKRTKTNCSFSRTFFLQIFHTLLASLPPTRWILIRPQQEKEDGGSPGMLWIGNPTGKELKIRKSEIGTYQSFLSLTP